MVFYSFYTTWNRKPDSLVYRTEDGWSELQNNIKMFTDKKEAEKDFFSLLFDNEDFRIGEYFDTEKGKKKTTDPQKKDSVKIDSKIYTIPEDFKLELNKVYNLDCLTFMKSVPTGYFDYIFTSPPYNIKKQIGSDNLYKVYGDDLTPDEYLEWLSAIIDEGLRITKKHFFMNIQMLGNNKTVVLRLFGKYAFRIKDRMIWKKKIVAPHIQEGIMNSGFEDIIIFSNDEPHKKKFYDANWKQGTFSNVIEGINASQNQHSSLNKATFPLYLPRTVIQKFGKKKDIWYDPFNGTGTTFHACELEDRYFVGTELDPEQCVVSEDRVELEQSKLKIEFPEDSFADENKSENEFLEIMPEEKDDVTEDCKDTSSNSKQGELF